MGKLRAGGRLYATDQLALARLAGTGYTRHDRVSGFSLTSAGEAAVQASDAAVRADGKAAARAGHAGKAR